MSNVNVHIMGVGYDPKPILSILRSDMPCDRIHLLWNSDPKIESTKNTIVESLMASGFQLEDIITDEVDVFDYQNILTNVMLISQMEKNRAAKAEVGVQFFMNITHGTRLVTGALCTASLMVGAKMYYLKERDESTSGASINDLIIRIPAPKIPDLDRMTTERRRFLKKVCSNDDGISVSELSEHFKSKQNVNQFVGYFERYNFVERKHEGKNVRIEATDLGKMAVKWLL